MFQLVRVIMRDDSRNQPLEYSITSNSPDQRKPMENEEGDIIDSIALKPGYSVHWYEILRILGRGGFGITYLAKDTNLNRMVAIKEFLPNGYAHRESDSTIKPLSGEHGDVYKWGLDSFIKEAQTLAKFRQANIVHVLSVFEANNSAYMVMEYVQGEELSSRFSSVKGNMSQQELEGIFFPVMEGLKKVHNAGFIHRDIKPANIFLRKDGTPVLLDFGAARQTLQQQSGEMTVLVSRGYTPPEQYGSSFGKQGSWTDVYAIACCMYEGIVGEKPADALQRIGSSHMNKSDPVQPLAGRDLSGYTPEFLNAVDKGLILAVEDRPQSLDSWLGMFTVNDEPTVMATQALHPPGISSPVAANQPVDKQVSSEIETREKSGIKVSGVVIAGSVVALLISLVIAWYTIRSPDETPSPIASDTKESIEKPVATGDAAVPITDQKDITETSKIDENTGAIEVQDREIALDSQTELGKLVISTAYLDSLPSPEPYIALATLSENSIEIAQTLKKAGETYSEAARLTPENEDIDRALETVLSGFYNLLKTPWVSANPDVKQQIVLLGKSVFPQQFLLENLDKDVAAYSDEGLINEVLSRISENRISHPEGQSLIDLLPYINNVSIRTQLESEPQWTDFLYKLKVTADRAIQEENFGLAAEVVQTALEFSPDDAEFNLLRRHLTGVL